MSGACSVCKKKLLVVKEVSFGDWDPMVATYWLVCGCPARYSAGGWFPKVDTRGHLEAVMRCRWQALTKAERVRRKQLFYKKIEAAERRSVVG